jgi:hypothetical protein
MVAHNNKGQGQHYKRRAAQRNTERVGEHITNTFGTPHQEQELYDLDSSNHKSGKRRLVP